MKFAVDNSMRRYDENGFLHVKISNISKECVNGYYGYEIPYFEENGLEENTLYYGYRSGEELELAADSFNGLPLLRGHFIEHADSPQKEHRVGSLGTDARFTKPYLQNSLIITDGEAIRKIESGERVELSAAYAYEPLFVKGTFEGQHYDFIMTNIRGNHVALVEEGRAGADVVVADEKPLLKQKSFGEEIKPTPDIQEDSNEEEKNQVFLDLVKILLKLDSFCLEEIKQKLEEEYVTEPLPTKENTDLQNTTANDSKRRRARNLSSKSQQNMYAKFHKMQEAVSLCSPFTGELNILAFDCAEDIYLKACQLMKVKANRASASDVIKALHMQRGRNVQTNTSTFRSRFE